MGFWFAYSQLDGTIDNATVTEIMPRPTRVDYDHKPLGQTIVTSGGTVVHQQPARENRIRGWEWVGYPGWFIRYQDLWTQLEPLRSRYRAQAGLSPYVYLKEDESRELALIGTPTQTSIPRTYPFFKCRVLGVTRETRKDGGLLVFEVTRLEFVIEDASWNYLG